jgi:CheY-like chemotaxis protein
MLKMQPQVEQNTIPYALVVDDNEFNRDICRIALEYAGYTVIQAANGEEALAMLPKQGFTLLVLDLQMPVVDGYAVLKQVRANSIYQDLYIIVMTAHESLATTEVHDAANRVIFKPIDIMGFSGFAHNYKQSLTIKH